MLDTWTVGERTTRELLASLPIPAPVIGTHPGVYDPSVDSALLCLRLLAELSDLGTTRRRRSTVLEVCAGSGIASVCAALVGADVTAVDDTLDALAAIAANSATNGVAVTMLLADARELPSTVSADLVVANPPYIPAPDTAPGGHAWNAGPDGREVLDGIIDSLPSLVNRDGTALLVHSDVCGVAPTLQRLRGLGFVPSITDEIELVFGPIMTERAEWLEQRGFIAEGCRTERIVVVRATRPDGA